MEIHCLLWVCQCCCVYVVIIYSQNTNSDCLWNFTISVNEPLFQSYIMVTLQHLLAPYCSNDLSLMPMFIHPISWLGPYLCSLVHALIYLAACHLAAGQSSSFWAVIQIDHVTKPSMIAQDGINSMKQYWFIWSPCLYDLY